MKVASLIVSTFTALLISACGGGSTSVSTPVDNSTPNTVTPDASDDLQTGRFVDSAVAGLAYSTLTQSGVTDTDGMFSYRAGETVTFSIGDVDLPATPGADIITPLSVFSTDDITDTRVMNLSRLLQTLDVDGNPVNGITLSDSAAASATGLSIDFAADDFESQVVNLVANSGSTNTALVNSIEALDHLQETLFLEGIDERPPMPMAQAPQPTSDIPNTATHPLVGTTAEFSNLAHDISGTLTVVDDRTLRVDNFNYDGGGVVVFFYTGTDGNYSGANARELGPQLNGRPYNNETITLTLPDDLTLDDFNSVSVWCVPFSASFGDALL